MTLIYSRMRLIKTMEMINIHKNDVIQFNEKHEWSGCFGIIMEVRGSRLFVKVPSPKWGTGYIECNADEVEIVGIAKITSLG